MDNSRKAEIKREQILKKAKRDMTLYHKKISESPRQLVQVDEQYEAKENLNPFSWKLYDIDKEAVADFQRTHDCTYQDIIKYALRFYLSEENYRHAKEVIELRKKHDKEHYEG